MLKVSVKFSEIILQYFEQKVKYHILQSYKNKKNEVLLILDFDHKFPD